MQNKTWAIFKIFIATLITLISINLFQLCSSSTDLVISQFLKSIYFTLILSLRLFLLIGVVQLSVSFLSDKVANLISVFISLIIVIIHFLLVNYQLETGILLGADFFGYTISDIQETVSSSGSINFIAIISLTFALAIYTCLSWFLWNRKWSGENLIYSVPLIFVISFLLPISDSQKNYENESQYFLVQNPSNYFLTKSFQYLSRPKVLDEDNFVGEYPFLHDTPLANPLSDWLKKSDTPPNIVIVAVEGLGADFVGPEARFKGFTPFLDSLINYSAYWPNCLSNTGRTFGVMPTLLGSLPYSGSGFMSLGTDMPDHFTLFSWLKNHNYHTSYFYGGNANFDQQDIFLERQKTDYILYDSKFPSKYEKMTGNSEGFSWGYADRDVFDFSMEKINEFNVSPRISFYMTLTTHEPFISPDESYDTRVKQILLNNKIEKELNIYQEYLGVFSCLLYTDEALRFLIKSYSKREDFENTIFIITGDHRLIPIPAKNRFDRFRVPLIIYSPLLKKAFMNQQLASHSQIAPSIVSYLNQDYDISAPSQVSFISEPLSDKMTFASSLDVALMRNKNELEEYIEGDLLLSNDELFRISEDLSLITMNDQVSLNRLRKKLALFKLKSDIALHENRLLPKDMVDVTDKTAFKITDEEKDFLISANLIYTMPDTLLMEAQKLAFRQDYIGARIILKYGLNKSPNYHDLRVLMARTLAWEGSYDSAFYYLDEVLKRSEGYEDAYIAYSDAAYWKEDISLSKEMVVSGLKIFPRSIELKARLARIYLVESKLKEAKIVLDEVLKENPNLELALSLKNRLNNLNGK